MGMRGEVLLGSQKLQDQDTHAQVAGGAGSAGNSEKAER